VAFAAYAVFAFSDASVKILHGGVPAFQLTFIGSLFGAAALPFLKTKSDDWGDLFRTTNRSLWLVRFFAGAIASICSVVAFTKLPMAEAFALLFLLPSFVTILSVIFLKEDVRWQRWTAVGIGFLGVLIILRPGFRELSIGHFCAAVGGFTSAISIVIFRALGPSEKRLSLYSAALFGVLTVSGILMLTDMHMPTAREWLFLAGYGVFGTFGNILMMLAAKLAPASLVAPPQYSQMIWAIIFGYLIFDDSIDLPMAFGIVLIIFSGLMTLIRERVRKTTLPPSVAGTSNPAAIVAPDGSDERSEGNA
jgi:drug/metabolite transporter (DMT)-like permease